MITFHYLCYMESKNIIHLYLKETGENRYFGSPSAMYELFSKEDLGISRQSLLNYYCLSKKNIYENNKCVIRKGVIERKEK